MNKPENLYDVYVSYPPGIDKERINACLYDNLPDNEAEDLIRALSERPQAIIAENCTQEERENAKQYFNYLGLDVIVRQSLELRPHTPETNQDAAPAILQCPVCLTLVEQPDLENCAICDFHFASANETTIQRKRIEWEEKRAFELKKQKEIEQRLERERLEEEKRLRKQIRAEMEEQFRQEQNGQPSFYRRHKAFILGMAGALIGVALLLLGFVAAKFL